MPLPASIEDKYEVLAKLSEGGMGAVYKVRHRLLDEIRVVKIVLPHAGPSSELRDRFLREARAASRLGHPNIARILDFLVDDQGQQLLVLEHIDGLTLKEVLALSGPPPLGLALETARQALDALGTLHGRGFVHRDVAPDNLMLARDTAGRPLVKLIDLGIAKAVSGDLDASLTQTGIFLGKPRYASPEQLAGEPVDARSDLYSFGIVLYELLTGRYPFRGRTVQELFAAHLQAEPLSFAESDPDGMVPAGLREIVLCLLAKKPDDRFATAAELAAALAPFAVPWPDGALGEILGRRPAEETRTVLEFNPVAAVATRRTVQPEPPPSAGSTPPPAAEPTFFNSWQPARRSPRLILAALVLGLASLVALGLWLARSGASGKPSVETPSEQTSPPPALTPEGTVPASPALGFSPAQPLGRPEPVYPDQARSLGLSARVTVDLDIDEHGQVVNAAAPFVDAEKSIPWHLYSPFKEAALQAARALRFQPAIRDGVAVKDKVRLVLEVKP